jgi:two-component system chemotaxis response regulator CheY
MPARILVIDDSLPLLKAVREGLLAAGYEVETSTQPLQMALDLGRIRPDLVLLDVEMPEVRGTEVLATLRENAATIRADVILFSSKPEEELERMAAEAGAQGWIRKASPLNPGRLAREVRRLVLARKEAQEAAGERVSAMVVDDSRAMRHILRTILESASFDVVEASHGRDALAQLEAHPKTPQLLLVDLNMPEMNGYELIAELRLRFTSELRILMVTSETDPSRIQTALEAGANEYLMKPFSRESLLEKLEFLELPIR